MDRASAKRAIWATLALFAVLTFGAIAAGGVGALSLRSEVPHEHDESPSPEASRSATTSPSAEASRSATTSPSAEASRSATASPSAEASRSPSASASPVATVTGTITATAAGSISGVVRKPDDTPATAGSVGLLTLDHERARDAAGHLVDGVSIGSDGAFSFRPAAGLRDSGYFVVALPGDAATGLGASFETPVRLVHGVQDPPTLIVKLQSIQLAGAVLDPSGQPLTHPARIKVTSSDRTVVRHVSTGRTGKFRIGGLPATGPRSATPYTYRLDVTPPEDTDFSPASLSNVALGSQSLTITLGGASISGRIVLPNSTTGVGGAHLALVTSGGREGGDRAAAEGGPRSDRGELYETTTRPDGTFAFGHVDNGTYSLQVLPPFDLAGVSPVTRTGIVYAGSALDLGTIQLGAATKQIVVTVTGDDGSAITTNLRIQAVERDGGGFVAENDPPGTTCQCKLTVAGGTWLVSVASYASPGDWAFGGAPIPVQFATDATAETRTINFTVRRALAFVSGKVLHADDGGNVPFPAGSVTVRVQDSAGFGSQGTTDADGKFSFRVPPGTYGVRVFPADQDHAPPASLAGLRVTVGQTGNTTLDDIVFGRRSATLAGSVVDPAGTPVPGILVHVWRKDGDGAGDAVSGSDGAFSIPIEPGNWFLAAAPTGDSGYAAVEKPRLVEVESGETKPAGALHLVLTDAMIEGRLVDSVGRFVSARGMVTASGKELSESDRTRGVVRGPIVGGRFTLKVPHGQYKVVASFSPGSGFGGSASADADVAAAGATTQVALTVVAADATIAGAFLYTGAPLTGQAGSIFSSRSGGRDEWTRLEPATGAYSMKVTPGEWFLRGYLDSHASSYVVLNGPSNKVTAASGQTSTLNFTVIQAGGQITGTVTRPDGTALAGARVSAIDVARVGREPFPEVSTNADGVGGFTLKVPAGTYRVNAAAGNDYVPPVPQTVTITATGIQPVNLQFRALNARITGKVTLAGVGVSKAFVRGYPSGGGAGRSVRTAADGSYDLSVVGGVGWVVQAVYEAGDGTTITGYKSDKANVAVPASGGATQDLVLKAVGTMPAPVAITFDVSRDQTVTLADGTRVIVPAGAMGSAGNATLQVTPKSQVEETLEHRTLGIAYELVALDASGQPIVRFNSPVAIVLTYDPAALPGGVSPTDLIPRYWDSVSHSWKPAENVVLNRTDNTITISVSHFTEYAITTESISAYRQLIPLGLRNNPGG